MNEGEAQAQSSSPGARLAVAREQAGMTLAQAAERLRLDVATLQALEAGRFDTLGAAVFVRGHLRHYAELVGVPVSEIEAAYAASSAKLAPLPDLRGNPALPAHPAPRGFSLPPRAALIGAIVLVLLALVWWAMRVPGRRQAANPSAPSAAASPASAPTTGAADAGPQPAAPAAPAPAHTEAAAAAKTPVAAAKDTVVASKDAASASREAAPKSASATVRLAIKFNQDSWAEIYDARGSTLFHDFGGAGSERRVTGTAPLRVLIGNPDGVLLELDGHPVALRPAAESGRPQRFVLDSVGHTSEAATPQSQRTAP